MTSIRTGDIKMKIQRSDKQNKETSNMEQTTMFSSIDHEIEESISKRLKTTASNISETSDEKTNTSDSNRGALISEIASRMNRPCESDIRLFTLDQIFLWIKPQDLFRYNEIEWNELIDYISIDNREASKYKQIISNLKSIKNMSDLDVERQNIGDEEKPVNNRFKVIDNDENIEDIKRIEDLYKK